MKYRKRPVEVEAFQYDGELVDAKGEFHAPEWAIEAFTDGSLYYSALDSVDTWELFIYTLEGDMHVSVGDYVIKGTHGEFYPCKPDIFKETYEAMDRDTLKCIYLQEDICCNNKSKFVAAMPSLDDCRHCDRFEALTDLTLTELRDKQASFWCKDLEEVV